jgi:hypothetical protein
MGTSFFLGGWGLGFTAYVVVQVVALLALRKSSRRNLVLLPAPFMLGVLLWTVYAYQADSNLWPIVMIFASPMAVIAVLVTSIALRLTGRRHLATSKQHYR